MANIARTTFFHHGWTSFFGQFNATSIDMRFNFIEEQQNFLTRNAILALIINLMQLKYQGKDETPFETHPKTMCVAVTSLLLYWFLSGAKLGFSSPTYASIVRHGLPLFESCSLACLASTLFTDSIRPVLYVIFITLSASELLQWFCWTVMGEARESLIPGRSMVRRLIDSQMHRGAHAFTNDRNRLPV